MPSCVRADLLLVSLLRRIMAFLWVLLYICNCNRLVMCEFNVVFNITSTADMCGLYVGLRRPKEQNNNDFYPEIFPWLIKVNVRKRKCNVTVGLGPLGGLMGSINDCLNSHCLSHYLWHSTVCCLFCIVLGCIITIAFDIAVGSATCGNDYAKPISTGP